MEAVAAEIYENKFVEFFDTYYAEAVKALYVTYPQSRSMMVNMGDLEKFDHELAEEMMRAPDEVIPYANKALAKFSPDPNMPKQVYARFYGLDLNSMPLIQDIGSEQVGKLITLDSLVIKRSEIMPKIHIGTFQCAMCGTTVKLEIERDEVPEVCPQCKRRALRQMNKESTFIDLQRIATQDPLEKLKGNIPTWQLEVWLMDDLVNSVLPGDRVEVTGILRIRPRRTMKGKQEKAIFTMFLDACSLKAKQKEFAEIDITQDEEKVIRELANDPHIFEKIAQSIATSIYGHDEIKRAAALQLFGGTPDKKLVDGGAIRNDIHMLLIGDPGTAKTRILQSVAAIVPKGIYVSGKSTSSAGLTAAAERDELAEGGWTLKAGALVLGSGGNVMIDEFDKITDEDKSSLLEAMESQTISVAKAGIVARFNAKTSILASANPKYGRFDFNQYLAEQFNIPPTLLSRFDLIFPIKDVMDEEQDRNIAKYILTQHEAAGAKIQDATDYEQVLPPPIDQDMLRKYIAYARKNIRPRLSKEASTRIQLYYIELRKLGMKQGATPITPRQIEGLVRLAEASAKSRLSNTVEMRDAELAVMLNDHMLKTLAVDRGGRMDIDILQTGTPREKVEKINTVMGIIRKLQNGDMGANVGEVYEEGEKGGMDRNTTRKYIDELEKSGDVYMPKPGFLKVVRHEGD